MDPRFQEIADALTDYFDGIYEGDVTKLERVFLPEAHRYSATEGEVVDWPLDRYKEVINGREAPAKAGAKRYDRILSIDFSGTVTANVKVELAVPPKYFTDFLTMLKVDGRWRIVSKTFDYVIHE